MNIIPIPATLRNHSRIILATSILGAFALTACERKQATENMSPPINPTMQSASPVAQTSTFETSRLGLAIDTFEKAPTVENQSTVKLAFAKLDGEIAELQDRAVKTGGSDHAEALAKSRSLQVYRDAEMLRFTKDQDRLALDANPPVDSRTGAQKVKDAAVNVGDKVEDGAQKVGRTLDKAARKTGDAIEDVTQ